MGWEGGISAIHTTPPITPHHPPSPPITPHHRQHTSQAVIPVSMAHIRIDRQQQRFMLINLGVGRYIGTMSTQNPPAIDVRSLSKSYGKTHAVRSVSFVIEPGESVALLGPNGAGKTTLLDMIEGIASPTSGQVQLFGMGWASDAPALRQLIGLSLQSTAYLDYVSIGELAQLFATLTHSTRQRAHQSLEQVGLAHLSKRSFKALSGGEKQRFSLAMAVMHRPRLLLLDEPTTALDPNARHDCWSLIQGLKRDGITVLLTTHYMDEATALSDRIILINQGQLVADGTLATLLQQSGLTGGVTIDTAAPLDTLPLPWVVAPHRQGWLIASQPGHPDPTVQEVLTHLDRLSVTVRGVQTHQPTLDDVFRYLTGRDLS